MSTLRVYLVIGADKSVRASKRPQIKIDEVAIAINLEFPDGWGRVVGDTIDVQVPGLAPTEVSIEQ